MNPGVVLLLLLGGFLIMDAVSEARMTSAEQSCSKKKRKYVPMSMYDEQLSGITTRDKFSDMFYSSGPWHFRDNALDAVNIRENNLSNSVPEKLNDRMPTPASVSAEMRRVDALVRGQIDKMNADPRAITQEGFYVAPIDGAERLRARRMKRKERQDKKTI